MKIMALFKILKGKESDLPIQINEGYCYLCTDNNLFYIDTSPTERVILNANDAKTLLGRDLDEETVSISEDKIPTSKAITDVLTPIKTEIADLESNKVPYNIWTAKIMGQTWSRLCYIQCAAPTIGCAFILNIAGTRDFVVYHDTFVIKAHHSRKASISKISGNTYNNNTISIRVIPDTYGNCYVELYDDILNISNKTVQSVNCQLIPIFTGEITKYTTFTAGNITFPSNEYKEYILTTNTNSLQGELAWDEITDKPLDDENLSDLKTKIPTSGVVYSTIDSLRTELTAKDTSQDEIFEEFKANYTEDKTELEDQISQEVTNRTSAIAEINNSIDILTNKDEELEDKLGTMIQLITWESTDYAIDTNQSGSAELFSAKEEVLG